MNKKYILKKNEEIQNLYKVGKRVSSKLLSMVYRKNELGNLRIVFTVSKKNGNSPSRNKIRRRLKSIASKSMLIAKSYDIAINVKIELMNVTFEVLKKEFDDLCKKFMTQVN